MFSALTTDWIDLLVVQTIRSLLQHHSLKASVLQHSAFFTIQLSQLYVATAFCNPTDCSLPVSPVHGISQARILNELFPSLGDLPDPVIEPMSPELVVVV